MYAYFIIFWQFLPIFYYADHSLALRVQAWQTQILPRHCERKRGNPVCHCEA